MSAREQMTPELTPLVVEIVCPHYLFSLLTQTYASDPRSWIGAEITMHGDGVEDPIGPYVGDFHGVENVYGDWLICIHDMEDDDRMILRTHIENVRKIVVL